MPNGHKYLRWCSLAAALCVAAGWGPRPAGAQSGNDLVLVVDVSTSMRQLFPEVRERLYQEIDQAHVGDRVVLVTFGEGAHLVARRRVRGPADRAYIRALVQSLVPVQRATYVTKGLDRGFRELEALFQKSPDRERRLLWLSDNKNNPPALLGDDVLTLADLRETHTETTPGGEWFAFDAPLAERLGAEVGEFLQWVRRSRFYLGLRESRVALGAFPGPEVTVQTTLHFVPQHSALAGLEFLVLARVTEATDPSAQPRDVLVQPGTVTVQAAEWGQAFTLAFEAPPGAYSGYLIFESYAPENFLVEPERIPLTLTLEAPPLRPAQEPELPTVIAEQADDSHAPAVDVAARRLGRADRPLVFGPVAPGRRYEQTLTVRPTVPVAPERVRLETRMPLPEGFQLHSSVTRDGTDLRVRLTLDVDKDVRMEDVVRTGMAITGRVRFHADDANVRLHPAARDLVVELAPAPAPGSRSPAAPRRAPADTAMPSVSLGGGIQRMAADAVTPRPPQPEPASPSRPQRADPPAPRPPLPDVGTWLRRTGYARSGLLVLGASLGLWVGVLAFRRRAKPTTLFGELVVVRDPGRRKLRDLNLRRIGARRGREVLQIGAGGRADIRLRHPSVRELHARVLTEARDGEIHVVLDPARGADIRVNDQAVTEPRLLQDKDLLALGDYLFLFSAPQGRRRAVVQFIDGSVLEGTPVDWNIAQPNFQLLVERPGAPDEVAHVQFADLKAVFFVSETHRDAPAAWGPGTQQLGEELRVEFSDGDTLAGYAVNGYTDYAQRFYVVPKGQTDMVSVLVERANTTGVTKATSPPGAANGGAGTTEGRFRPWKSGGPG